MNIKNTRASRLNHITCILTISSSISSVLQIQFEQPSRVPTPSLVSVLLLLATVVLLHLLLVVSIVLLFLMVMLLVLPNRWALIAVSTIPVLGQQNTADAFVNRLQLSQVGRGNLNWITSNGKNNNVLPRMDLVLVFHHLWPLPVILNAGTLQRELLHLHRDRSASLCFNDSDVVLRLE